MRGIFLLLSAACATSGGAGSGTIAIKSVANAAAPPATYSVGSGVITGSDLDLRLDQDCLRGTMGRTPIDLCRDPGNPNRWTGASGDFTAVASPDGRRVNVEGYLTLGGLRQLDITQVIPLEKGTPWEEMRKHPELLALATTATDLEALHRRRGPQRLP